MIKSRLQSLIRKKQAQDDRKITYDEIAGATAISKSTLSRIANNQRVRYDAHMLSALCKYFRCNVGDLLEYVPDEECS